MAVSFEDLSRYEGMYSLNEFKVNERILAVVYCFLNGFLFPVYSLSFQNVQLNHPVNYHMLLLFYHKIYGQNWFTPDQHTPIWVFPRVLPQRRRTQFYWVWKNYMLYWSDLIIPQDSCANENLFTETGFCLPLPERQFYLCSVTLGQQPRQDVWKKKKIILKDNISVKLRSFPYLLVSSL